MKNAIIKINQKLKIMRKFLESADFEIDEDRIESNYKAA